MNPLLATSPLVQLSPPKTQGQAGGLATDASFAVTPNSSFTARVMSAGLSPRTQRVLFNDLDTTQVRRDKRIN